MNIAEAMRAVNDEYNQESIEAQASPALHRAMTACVGKEYAEIDVELPGYVAEIAAVMGVAQGTFLPDYVYQTARMAFRMGMRTQRKLDHPEEATTLLWRSGRPQ